MENDAEFMTHNLKCNKYENKNGFTFESWCGEGHWNADYTIIRTLP